VNQRRFYSATVVTKYTGRVSAMSEEFKGNPLPQKYAREIWSFLQCQ